MIIAYHTLMLKYRYNIGFVEQHAELRVFSIEPITCPNPSRQSHALKYIMSLRSPKVLAGSMKACRLFWPRISDMLMAASM
jgi:hypothetical protein